MEQILAFVLGVSMGVFVWTVVVAFRTAKLAKQNEKDIRNLEDWISRNDESAHRRIDQEIDRVNNLHKDSISYIDSRADKLDSKIENNKHLLKG
jgi:heme/copper-type cytochrome/quinol oxidase subunit 1